MDQNTLNIVIKARNEAQAALDQVNASLGRTGRASQDTGEKAEGMGISFLGSIKTAAKFAGIAAVAIAVKESFDFAKGAAIGMNATLETSTLQFGTLMGDATRAEAHVKSLFEFAKKT